MKVLPILFFIYFIVHILVEIWLTIAPFVVFYAKNSSGKSQRYYTIYGHYGQQNCQKPACKWVHYYIMQIAMPDRNLQNIPQWILLEEKDPIKRYAISQISSLSSIFWSRLSLTIQTTETIRGYCSLGEGIKGIINKQVFKIDGETCMIESESKTQTNVKVVDWRVLSLEYVMPY
jgi:hypothetical protein